MIVFEDSGIWTRVACVVAFSLLESVVVHRVLLRLRSGAVARVALGAVLAAFRVAFPFAVLNFRQELLFSLAMAFSIGWLGMYKVMGAALGRGPLIQPLSFWQLHFVTNLPITLAMEHGKADYVVSKRGGSAHALFMRLAVKIAALLCAVYAIPHAVGPAKNGGLPAVFLHLVYAVGLYCYLGVFMDGSGFVLEALLGVKLAPHFDNPFAMESLTDYWGRRWNLVAGGTLRFLIYDPIVEARLTAHSNNADKPPCPMWRRSLGVCASFVASGLMHEYILSLCSAWDGRWFVFFALQGPLVLAEYLTDLVARRTGISIPPLIRRIVGIALLEVTAYHFFFPPVEEAQLCERTVDGIMASYKDTFASLQRIMGRTQGADL